MKVLIRNIAMLLAVLCGTFTVYAQTGQNTPQSVESKINVITIEPLSVAISGLESLEDEPLKVIQGETRDLSDYSTKITFAVKGEANQRIIVDNNGNGVAIGSNKGVSYDVKWIKGAKADFDGSKEKNKLNAKGNGLNYSCILKSVTATADADLGEHIHEFTITVHYADY